MKNNINNVLPKASSSVPQTKVPARSVSRGGEVTPSSSTSISRSKQIGSNPNFLPKLAGKYNAAYGPLLTQEAYNKRDLSHEFRKTLEDLKTMKNADRIKALSKIMGSTGLVGAAYGAAKKNKSIKNYSYAVAGMSGLLHGAASGIKDSTENHMNDRNARILKGFKKQAVAGGLIASTIGLGKMLGGSALPAHALAVSATDILTLPYLSKKVFKNMRNSARTQLMKDLGMDLTSSQKRKAGIAEFAMGAAKGFQDTSKKLGDKLFGRGSKGTKFMEGAAKHLNSIGKGALGTSGYEYASHPLVKNTANIMHQIDPKLTKRIIDAIPDTAEGAKNLRYLKAVGKRYAAQGNKIEKAYMSTKNLKPMLQSKPGSSEQFMANLGHLWGSRANIKNIGKTTDTLVDHINDLDSALGVGKEIYKDNQKLIDMLRALNPNLKAKDIEDFFDNPGSFTAGANKVKDALNQLKAGAKGVGTATAIGVGSGLGGYMGARAADKAKDDREIKDRIQKILRRKK